ncbi:hypothetical protein OUZ56_010310 [Daphnia magna]|uniref:Uncharacterized protein n=1 Tax=Daphnia magna TaxID=35525 RepID=A0ABR0AI65_9CRUS|nr:hypothetical protein OUZ56_010310 [Daphnia magna]
MQDVSPDPATGSPKCCQKGGSSWTSGLMFLHLGLVHQHQPRCTSETLLRQGQLTNGRWAPNVPLVQLSQFIDPPITIFVCASKYMGIAEQTPTHALMNPTKPSIAKEVSVTSISDEEPPLQVPLTANGRRTDQKEAHKRFHRHTR